MECAVCLEGLGRRVQERRTRKIGRWEIEVDDGFYRYERCDEEFYTPEQLQDADARDRAALKVRHGVLLPEEIRALRGRLALTQAQFEALLGVGRNTVVRWESGHTWPNAATNTLLRLLDADPSNARRLAEWHGVTLPSAA
jgi:putative zinc finger/helix-turn-helix YgiT family protein